MQSEIRAKRLHADPRTLGLWHTPGTPAPLSTAQDQMLLLQAIRPDNVGYHTFTSLRLHGDIGPAAVADALDATVQRHEVLRTVYRIDGDRPVQIVRNGRLICAVADLRHLAAGVADVAVGDILRRTRHAPFDLADDWPIRASLIMLDVVELVVGVAIHHIAFDGWSEHLFWGEVRDRIEGRAGPYGPLPVQYADYAAWQREAVDRTDLNDRLDYWLRHLHGAPSHIALGRHTATAPTTEIGLAHPIEFDPVSTRSFREVLTRTGATAHMGMVAALSLFLGAWSGSEDIVIGSPHANRHGELSRMLIGNFVNANLYRSTVDRPMTFADTLERVRRQSADAVEQAVPHAHLIRALNPDRTSGDQAVYNVNLTLHNYPAPAREAEDVEVSEIELAVAASRFDLDVNLWENDTTITGTLLHRSGVLLPAEGSRCASTFVRLASALFAQPDKPLGDIRSNLGLHEAERCAPIPLVDRVAQGARRMPGSLAVRRPDGSGVTYAEMLAQVERLAERLRSAGAGDGSRVLIDAGRGAEAITAMLACLRAGAAYTAVDRSDAPGRVTRIVDLFDPNIVVVWTPQSSTPTVSARTAAPPEPGSGLAYVLFTSGSTGTPKGVRVTEAALRNYADWAAVEYRMCEGTGVPLVTAISVDLTVTAIFATLLAGQCIVTFPEEDYPGQSVAEHLSSYRDLTMVKLTPTHLAMVEREWVNGAVPARTLVLGGEALAMGTVRDLARRPEVRVFNEYGPTEITVACTAHRLTGTEPTADAPIGRPIAGAILEIVDPAGHPVPDGEAGELVVGGPGVAAGYHGAARATATAFLPDRQGTTRYATGDLVYRHPRSGDLHFVGRIDRQVKINGHRVELDEIAVVASNTPGVKQASACVGATGRTEVDLVADDAGDLLDAAVVSDWRRVFDHQYDGTTDRFAGWTDSATHKPIPHADMTSWVEETASRIRAAAPSDRLRILEIGCGTGLILIALAPFCVSYTATDMSERALDHVHAALAEPANAEWCDRVELRCQPADQIPVGEFDIIVLNSVAQYFPSGAYFDRVLAGVLSRRAPQGVVFIGDLRAPELDLAQAEWIERRRDPDPVTLADRVSARVAADPELRVSPDHLAACAPGLLVRCMPKATAAETEMGAFRVDVVIGDAAPGESEAADDLVPEEITDLEAARAHLHRAPVVLTNVAWRGRMAGGARVCPTEFHTLAESAGLIAQFEIPLGSGCDRYSVRLAPSPTRRSFATARAAPATSRVAEPARRVASYQDSIAARVSDAIAEHIGPWARPADIRFHDRVLALGGGKSAITTRPTGTPPAVTAKAAHADGWRRAEPVFRRILGRPVQPDDNFFLVGGHSLLAIQLVAAVRRELGADLAMRAPFDHPVLGELASVIDRQAATAPAEPTGPPVAEVTEAPLTAQQRGVWFDQVTHPNSTHLNMPLHVQLPDAVSLGVAATMVHRLIARHDGLRVRITVKDGRAVQRLDPRPPAVEVIDLAGLSTMEGERCSAVVRHAHLTTPFRLDREPPIRAAMIQLPSAVHAVLTIHHVAFDGVSEEILRGEAERILSADGHDPFDGPAASFLQYALRHGDTADTGDVRYWVDRLIGADSEIWPGGSRLVTPGGGGSRRRHAVRLTIDQSAVLRAYAVVHGITVFGVALTAIAQALADTTGRHDLVIAIDFGGRPSGAESTIGLFVNQLLLRCPVAATIADTRERLKHLLADVVAHPHAPYGAVLTHLREVNPDLARRPFQVKATYMRTSADSGQAWTPLTGLPDDVSDGLTLLCRDDGAEVALTAEYAAEAVPAGLAESVLARWLEMVSDLGTAAA